MSNGVQRVPRKRYRYLFGPVPSRRFGRSLGVDLAPRKTCAFDCVFCEVGLTTHRTLVRKEYVPTAGVISEIRHWLKNDGQADYITLCGSGEPTLHSRFGRILEAIHEMCDIKTALLTNGALLYLPEVMAAAAKADVVKVSLSAWDSESFAKLNRPAPGLDFRRMLEGMVAFRADFTGDLWLEVVAVSGFNSSVEAMRKIAALAREFRPDRVHLNTVVRPPPELVSPVSRRQLERYAPLFQPRAEVIAEFNARTGAKRESNKAEILAMLRRRPCTARDIAALGIDPAAAESCLRELLKGRRIRREKARGRIYYCATAE